MQNGPALIDGSPNDASGRRFTPRVVQSRFRPEPDARCDIRLTLAARAENVVLIRRIIGTLAETAALPRMRVDDVKLAVTEACTNVVRHAYGSRQGTLDVTAAVGDGGLEVIVTDDGDGIRPHAQASGGAGLGLPLMASVAHEFEIEQSRSRGTRVRMSFAADE
jgi:anti-sigma regulatory factor (Ser/Thr protein kinase)